MNDRTETCGDCLEKLRKEDSQEDEAAEPAYQRMLKQLRPTLMPYEDGMREMVTLGNAALVAMSLYEQGKRDAFCPMRCCEGLPKNI